MIELRNVGITVRGRVIVENGTATVAAHTVTHLVGPRGSGRSTLIRAIAGVQRHSGSIRFDGEDLARVRARLYACFDDAALFPFLDGYDNVRRLLDRPLPSAVIAEVAPDIADPSLLRLPARRLSLGQRKRIHLLAALASDARYLLLDETLDGADAPGTGEAIAALARRVPKATVLIAGGLDDPRGELEVRRIDLLNGSLIPTDDLADAITA
ncbi:MAG: ATP-binding cassette domain-containing protein [Galbitalea sp.]